jgi:hypothetical protein
MILCRNGLSARRAPVGVGVLPARVGLSPLIDEEACRGLDEKGIAGDAVGRVFGELRIIPLVKAGAEALEEAVA